MAESFTKRWLRPQYVLPMLGVAIAIATLLTPADDSDRSTRYLTTRSRMMNGARGLKETLDRLGYHTSERLVPYDSHADSNAIYILLGTQIDPSASEVHDLLGAVRRGASVIVVPEHGTPIADSIGMQVSDQAFFSLYAASDSLYGQGDPVDTLREAFGAFGSRVFHRFLEGVPASDTDTARAITAEASSFLDIRTPLKKTHPEIATITIGRGTVMAIADPGFLRNDVQRKRAGAVLAVRMLEHLDSTHTVPLVFDEYHQGFGNNASPGDALVEAMTDTTWGRAGLQMILAGLLYLLVIGVRPLAPISRARLERRSPLEHVGALSRAYEAIGATQLAVQRLVRGIRRRHPLGSTAQLTDREYLARLRMRLPAIGSEIDLLNKTLTREPSAEELVQAGAAIDHIERKLTT